MVRNSVNGGRFTTISTGVETGHPMADGLAPKIDAAKVALKMATNFRAVLVGERSVKQTNIEFKEPKIPPLWSSDSPSVPYRVSSSSKKERKYALE